MFYIAKGLKTTLNVEPNYLDMLRDKRFVLTQIKQKVEGKYYESVGYVILVREWINDPTCQDVLVEEDGSVSYKVAPLLRLRWRLRQLRSKSRRMRS